jgi:YfiH family protein
LAHGFLGRGGGASRGAWSALNLSYRVGDQREAVDRNWQRVRDAFAGLSIVTMGQVHGAALARVSRGPQRIEAVDGLFTDTAGVGLGVLTADCVPILMIAPAARVALAVHAGWRGTLAGIAALAVARAQQELGVPPAALRVAMGPAIGGCCYEVETSLAAQLEDRWGALGAAWQPAGPRGLLDLRAVNRAILTAAGVPADAIESVGPCTACDVRGYFSYRAGGGTTGRQLSVVGWL